MGSIWLKKKKKEPRTSQIWRNSFGQTETSNFGIFEFWAKDLVWVMNTI